MRRNVFQTYDPSLPLGKKFVAVHVQNEDPLYFLVDVKSKVCELFLQISKFLNLLEPELFGLAIKSSDTFIFMDPLAKLSKFAPKPWRTQNNGMDNDGLPLFQVYFRVQFYVDSYLYISDKHAKYYYYHQLRENVLRYEISMSEERAFLLASYALQADYGNYNPKLHRTPYFDPGNYFPGWVIAELGIEYIVRHLPTLHCDLSGMSKSEAQSMFIREASDTIAPHNFHLFKMSSKSHSKSSLSSKQSSFQQEMWLAVTITGLMIFATETPQRPLKTRISFFIWTDIGKLSFDKKKFEICSNGSQTRKFIYYFSSEELSRFILWLTQASHQFHFMVAPKMREMLKREAEINRRKYRETCVSSIGSTRTGSSRTSSGNSSGGVTISSLSVASSSNGGVMCNSSGSSGSATGADSGNSSNNTSKSVSPFEFITSSSVASSSGSSDVIGGKKKITVESSSSSSSSTNNNEISTRDDDDDDDEQHQRVSVISNASSNTTSGIASEKLGHGIDDSDRDDHFESNLLMSLNHRLAAHRTVTLSGCSPQPVVSMESLAMSEPIDHHLLHHHQNGKIMANIDENNLSRNKKHSISISNIMITESTPIKVTATTATTPAIVNNNVPTTSKLCLNINESTRSKPGKDVLDSRRQNNDSDDASSLYDDDDDDSVAFDSTNNKHGNGGCGGGKSSVTVLSTILKPEAERLLKQGIDVVDNPAAAGELLIDDGIDSLELAELKEFEQAEKEKIILNSLIDNIPPPPGSIGGHDSDSSSSYSDDSDDDDDRWSTGKRLTKNYSPSSEERLAKQRRPTAPKPNGGRLRSKSQSQVFSPPKPVTVPIYENVPPPNNGTPSKIPVVTPTPRPRYGRTGMRIGVSSLSRPNSAQQRNNLLLLQTATPIYGGHQLLGAGSEPNLFQQPPYQPPYGQMPAMKSDSVYDCRRVADPTDDRPSLMMTPSNSSELYLDTKPTTFRQFIKNQIPATTAVPRVMELSLDTQPITERQQDSNNNTIGGNSHHGSMMMTPPPSADYHKKQSTNNHHQISPLARGESTDTKTKTSQPVSNGSMCGRTKSQSTTNVSSKCDEHQQTKRPSGSRLKELRQRTSDLNLPLITALFNDSSLMESLTVLDPQDRDHKSQSMSHIGQHPNGNGERNPRRSDTTTAHRNSPVERSSTFRVDEAIGKSLLRKPVMTTTNQPPVAVQRPISWHVENGGTNGNGQQQYWRGCYHHQQGTTGHHQSSTNTAGQRLSYVHHHHLTTPPRPVVLQ